MHPLHPSSSSSGAASASMLPRQIMVTVPQQLHSKQQQLNDVIARAEAIARAQAQIQAQVQGYAANYAAASAYHQQRSSFPSLSSYQQQRSSFPGLSSTDLPLYAQPHHPNARQRTSSSSSTSSNSHSRQQRSHDHQARPQQQQQVQYHLYEPAHQNGGRASMPSAPSTSSSSSARSSRITSRRHNDEDVYYARNSLPGTSSVSSAAKKPSRVEWRIAIDPKSKKPYYYHPVTRETTWKKPQELVEKEKREKAQFFSVMENNIRSKVRNGHWFKSQSSVNSDEGVSSSATSTNSNSSRSSFGSLSISTKRALGFFKANKSEPNTPEGGRKGKRRAKKKQGDNQDDDIDDDDDDDARMPQLFRTLSSYETPVLCESKKNGIRETLSTVPSPIQERVRLAALAPRSSDVGEYIKSASAAAKTTNGRQDGDMENPQKSLKPTTVTMTAVDTRPPLRRRSNSTSTIYVRMGTMNAPDQDCTIECVATVLRAHMMEALEVPIIIDPKFDVFLNRRDPRLPATLNVSIKNNNDDDERTNEAVVVPSLQEIGTFIKHVFARAQMESECIIMSLIYVERLLKATSGELQLRASNWRSILFCSMVMASKVWDDLSMCNADFSKIWPEYSLKDINELELSYLSAVEYKVRVSAVSYAKYYFHLRSMCAAMGKLASFDESAPLNLDGARKMQVLSEEYQERAKLLPAPRRRSVTITTPSMVEHHLAASSSPNKAKASPAASLEELVHMQVRGAGGSSLAAMHRLSAKSRG